MLHYYRVCLICFRKFKLTMDPFWSFDSSVCTDIWYVFPFASILLAAHIYIPYDWAFFVCATASDTRCRMRLESKMVNCRERALDANYPIPKCQCNHFDRIEHVSRTKHFSVFTNNVEHWNDENNWKIKMCKIEPVFGHRQFSSIIVVC